MHSNCILLVDFIVDKIEFHIQRNKQQQINVEWIDHSFNNLFKLWSECFRFWRKFRIIATVLHYKISWSWYTLSVCVILGLWKKSTLKRKHVFTISRNSTSILMLQDRWCDSNRWIFTKYPHHIYLEVPSSYVSDKVFFTLWYK